MKFCSIILLLSAFFGQYVVCSWPSFSRCPAVRLVNGKVRIRARGRIMRFDCFDGYILVGNRYASCIHGKWDTPVPVCVSTRCTPPPTPPHTFMASKLDGGILMFFCEPGYSLVGSVEIYCDGRNWNGTTPSCRDSTVPPPTKCDFESLDLCMWEPDPHQDFDWRRHNFATSRSFIDTGPTYDHTFGAGNDGHYLYTEASGQLVNDTARIISPLFNSSLTESGCFSFWYHMYGITIGTLNIYFKYETISTWTLMFSKNGNQGNQWLQGIFDLPKSNVSFQIIIEGVRGLSYVSDIAIDDVAILQGDDCKVKNNSANATVSNDDQVEIVNAQQTCRGRCVYSMTEIVTTSRFGPENCYCTFDCAERSICCPDYEEYCTAVFSFTETTATSTYETKQMISTTRQVTLRPYNANSTNTTTHPPMRDPIYINPKDYIDPAMSNSSSTTTRKPIVTMTTLNKRATTKPPKRTTTSTIVRQNQTGTRETTFASRTLTTKYMELQDRSELHSEEQNPEKVKHDSRFDPLVVGIVSATVIVFSLTLVITIIVIRRRKTYKRGNGSALSEDSDVRFLTSDEILDFNLARPVENEEL